MEPLTLRTLRALAQGLTDSIEIELDHNPRELGGVLSSSVMGFTVVLSAPFSWGRWAICTSPTHLFS